MSTTTVTRSSTVLCAGVVVADHTSSPLSHVPGPGELVAAESLSLGLGGCASNVAICLRRMGLRSSVCGRVGDDLFGRMAADILTGAGVLVSALKVDDQEPTSQSLILNVKGQDRRFVHCFGANRRFSAEDIDQAAEPPPRVFYLGGYLILPGLDAEALADRLKRLRGQGSKIVLDVATPGPGDYLKSLEPVLPHVDLFLPNTDEALLILGEADPVKQARAFHEMGAERVVVTLGQHGAVAVSKGRSARIGAYPAEFVDGTGGGDAFDAGYIAGLVEGLGETECLKLASALGASCVRSIGTTAGVFSRSEAEEFMSAHPLSFEPL